MNLQERHDYYFKNWKNVTSPIKIPDYAKEFKLNKIIYYTGPNTSAPKNFRHDYGIWNDAFWSPQGDFSITIPCLAVSSDGIDNKNLPAFVGTRVIDDPYGGIIYSAAFGYGRAILYDNNFIKNIKHKIPWEEKKNEVIWRGSPTGPCDDSNTRIKFCDLYMDKYDVGITTTWDRWDPKYLKEKMTKLDMLKYKYQLSFEGNCGATDLIWKLSSNSVVIMKKPILESWTMEGLLKPYVHYIPLKDDLSELDKIIQWCKDNDEKCQEIVKNANNFMKQFENLDNEIKIWKMIQETYKKTFTFTNVPIY